MDLLELIPLGNLGERRRKPAMIGDVLCHIDDDGAENALKPMLATITDHRTNPTAARTARAVSPACVRTIPVSRNAFHHGA